MRLTAVVQVGTELTPHPEMCSWNADENKTCPSCPSRSSCSTQMSAERCRLIKHFPHVCHGARVPRRDVRVERRPPHKHFIHVRHLAHVPKSSCVTRLTRRVGAETFSDSDREVISGRVRVCLCLTDDRKDDQHHEMLHVVKAACGGNSSLLIKLSHKAPKSFNLNGGSSAFKT